MLYHENFRREFFTDQNSERFIFHGLVDHFVEGSDDNERDEITDNLQSVIRHNQHQNVRKLYKQAGNNLHKRGRERWDWTIKFAWVVQHILHTHHVLAHIINKWQVKDGYADEAHKVQLQRLLFQRNWSVLTICEQLNEAHEHQECLEEQADRCVRHDIAPLVFLNCEQLLTFNLFLIFILFWRFSLNLPELWQFRLNLFISITIIVDWDDRFVFQGSFSNFTCLDIEILS